MTARHTKTGTGTEYLPIHLNQMPSQPSLDYRQSLNRSPEGVSALGLALAAAPSGMGPLSGDGIIDVLSRGKSPPRPRPSSGKTGIGRRKGYDLYRGFVCLC